MNPVIAFMLGGLLVPIVVAECGEVSPALAKALLRWGARRLRSARKTERYTEEWLADLDQVPGKLTKLLWAFGVVFLGVVRLREARPGLDWTPREPTTPFATDSLFGRGTPQVRHRPFAVPAPRVPRPSPPPAHRCTARCDFFCSEGRRACIPVLGEQAPEPVVRPQPLPPRAGGPGSPGSDQRFGSPPAGYGFQDDFYNELLYGKPGKAAPPVIGL
ncbi:hypothetical protein [Actinokineospora spheciospongiae]|uniref:hypothetical protein n=1 Tax=Actinokineospora spheciospongiae TaxID=909613 RepID=UPI000D81E85B|nr:hypothetical protein [Actinokineospora spheciospongiae]PWW61924.1 hypothetical protein DFQ13_106172 [Actinokineospora spheciospongiae]